MFAKNNWKLIVGIILLAIGIFMIYKYGYSSCNLQIMETASYTEYSTESDSTQTRNAYMFWNANTESDLAGYRVYIGENSRVYSKPKGSGDIINKNLTSMTWLNLPVGKKYYFAVTAFDSAGNESIFSDEVSLYISAPDITPPDRPTGVNVTLVIIGSFGIVGIIIIVLLVSRKTVNGNRD